MSTSMTGAITGRKDKRRLVEAYPLGLWTQFHCLFQLTFSVDFQNKTMKTSRKLYAGILAMAISFYAQAYPGENIVRDPATRDYIITYWNTEMEPPGLETTTYVTATKIVPAIRSRFSSGREGDITYRYVISNGTQSKQVLGLIILDPVAAVIGTRDNRGMRRGTAADKAARMAALRSNEAALSTPVGWDGSVAFGIEGRTDGSVRIGWSSSVEHSTGLKPGSTMREFGYSSTALPGIIEAHLSGDSPVHGWSGEGPSEDSDIFQQVLEIEMHDYVSRNAAVPAIAVPVPFDAAAPLDRIRAHVSTWSGKQLLDPAFAAQLDRYMVAAANAYRSNQPKVGKEHIESVRKLLEHEHKYLDHDDEDNDDTVEHKAATRMTIDRLAARVLDFDLRYVLKRTEKGHEHDHDEGDRRKGR